ncbi:hypothetical protein FB481_101584 [Pseudomonas sp. AG1028]|nr:hypothetical protein FB481_101584 [Pseudomonas sp. AG1028]
MELSQRLRRFLLLICQSRSGQCLSTDPRQNRDT